MSQDSKGKGKATSKDNLTNALQIDDGNIGDDDNRDDGEISADTPPQPDWDELIHRQIATFMKTQIISTPTTSSPGNAHFWYDEQAMIDAAMRESLRDAQPKTAGEGGSSSQRQTYAHEMYASTVPMTLGSNSRGVQTKEENEEEEPDNLEFLDKGKDTGSSWTGAAKVVQFSKPGNDPSQDTQATDHDIFVASFRESPIKPRIVILESLKEYMKCAPSDDYPLLTSLYRGTLSYETLTEEQWADTFESLVDLSSDVNPKSLIQIFELGGIDLGRSRSRSRSRSP